MPLFGAHLSVAGGLHKAVERAVTLNCQTLQIFTANPNSWPVTPRPAGPAGVQSGNVLSKNANTREAPPLSAEQIRQFREAVGQSGLRFVTAHDSYLINLASPDDAHFARSVNALAMEMERAEALGLSYLVTHPGSHVGSGEEAGLSRIVAGLDEVHARCAGYNVRLLLETTAGQGSALGSRFEHLGAILQRANCADLVDVCFDTCHVFAAGYPLAAEGDYSETFQTFDELVGLSRLKLFHVNDSVKGLGSRVDRHASIGFGEVGVDAFRRLVTDPRFRELPMVIETPKEDDDGNEMDAANLELLRHFAAGVDARGG